MGLLNAFRAARIVPSPEQGLLGAGDDENWGAREPMLPGAGLLEATVFASPLDAAQMPLQLDALAYRQDAGGDAMNFLGEGGEGVASEIGGAEQPTAPTPRSDVLSDGSVKQRIYPNLERGALPAENVRAIVLHRTGGPTARSTLEAWKTKPTGTHFLIDNDGTIYQTANLDQQTAHVGNIRSRAEDERTLTPEERKEIARMAAANKGKDFKYYTDELHRHELTKAYPDRYPHNGDSIGIEVVGNYDKTQAAFVPPTAAQLASVGSLVEALKQRYALTNGDVFHHAAISYKDKASTEGKGLGY